MSTWSPELGQAMADRARHYLGVPYHHCGRNEHGLDCAGLVLRVCHDLGLMDWDEVDYSEQVDADRLRARLSRFCVEVREDEVLPGDILWFAVAGHPQHLAIYVGGPEEMMIHATNTKGRVVEHSWRAQWRRTFVGAWRWRGDAEGDGWHR